jgi:SAM-dependent methyltransferase
MDIRDLVRDELGAAGGYNELVAQAYDTWLPPDGNYTDVKIWRRFIRDGGGPALELGCGTGRLLLGYVEDGLDVEGLDASADMLAICRAHADERGLAVTLHHGDWLDLDLPQRFATIYNPSGSFSLVADDDDARTALSVWLRHLAPGGRLVVSMGVPSEDLDANYQWRVRRSATRPTDGVTFMVHEAFRFDLERQTQHILNKHEVWDVEGKLIATVMRRHRLRWWRPQQLSSLLREAGGVDVETMGDESAFVAVAASEG